MVHALLQSTRSSKPAFGVWLFFPSVHTARQVALAGRSSGLSWVCIDCEHGLTPLVHGVADTIAAISSLPQSSSDPPEAQNPSVLVRIPAPGIQDSGPSTAYQIKHALDAGAHGVIVPMVSTAADARQIALGARFPPIGRRGFVSPLSRQAWGVDDTSEYLKRSNDEVIVCAQIENRDAVENLEEIAQVDGIDVLFIGPYDLSLALGYPIPSPDPHPEVEKVIQWIKEVAHKHQKKVALVCTSGKQGKRRAEEGFDIINIQSDLGALAEGLMRSLADARGSQQLSERGS